MMSEHTLRWIAAGASVVLLITYLVSLYVDRVVLPKVEAQLQNCRLVADTRSFWGTRGRFGRSQRYAMVHFALTSTRLLSKKGWVDIDEVKSISRADRRWICIPMNIAASCLITLAATMALLGELW